MGDAMARVVHGLGEVANLLGEPPVVVGGLAVLARLSRPYRATVDLDLVDRQHGKEPQLVVLRAASGVEAVEPAAVLLPTPYGPLKVDVLEVRQAELDEPSDDPGDRLHASAHAWASDTASELTIEAVRGSGERIAVTTPIAEPGPLVAMKLQAIENRSVEKQGTDLLDIVRLTLDPDTRPAVLAQIGSIRPGMARDIDLHVDLWFVRHREHAMRRLRTTGGGDVTTDDLALVSELLMSACER